MNRPSRSLLAAGVAGAALLPALAMAPVLADESGSPSPTPSAEPTEPQEHAEDPREGLEGVDDLTPIKGGVNRDSAPDLTTGSYIDLAPSDKELLGYRIPRTVPGSTINVGLTVLGDDVDPKVRPMQLNLVIPGDKANVQCGQAQFDSEDRGVAMPVASIATWSLSTPECKNADALFLVLRNESAGEGIEGQRTNFYQLLPTGTPFQIDVYEEPPIVDPDQLRSAYGATWKAVSADTPTEMVEPGVSKSSAARLNAGAVTRVNLPVGRPSWFYVPADQGESVQALARIEDGTELAGASVELRLMAPVGGLIDIGDEIDRSDYPGPRAAPLKSGGNVYTALSYEIGPAKRGLGIDAFDDKAKEEQSPTGQKYALPGYAGDYYVLMYAQKLAGSSVETVPVNLVASLNEHETYAEDPWKPAQYSGETDPMPTPSGAEPEKYDAEASAADAEGGSDADASDSNSSDGGGMLTWLLAGGLALGALVLGGVGIALARKR